MRDRWSRVSLLARDDAPVVLNRLLDVKARDGQISRALVGQAAEALGVAEATIWRWVAAGQVPTGRRPHFSLTDEDWTAYFQWCGSAAAAWRQRTAEPDGPNVSLATYKRAIGRELSARDRAFARDGERGARRYSLWIRRAVVERNAMFHTDHKGQIIRRNGQFQPSDDLVTALGLRNYEQVVS
jgi:hypothetical protein